MKLFFIRRFNDLDHIVPIIYKLAKVDPERILILCQNPYLDIFHDFRLVFLREKFHNVQIDYVYNRHTPTLGHRFLASLILNYHKKESFKFIFRNLFKLSRLFMNERYFNVEWAKDFFTKVSATVLVFDYINIKQHITKTLVEAARHLNIPTIGVPHGLSLFSEDEVNYQEKIKTNLDHFVVSYQGAVDYYVRHGFASEKLTVIGSARFCQEWKSVLYGITPEQQISTEEHKGKLKVVYMDRGMANPEYEKIIRDSFERIAGLDFVHLVLKPHIRSNRMRYKELSNLVEYSNADSLRLIQWADVVIVIVSSIIAEVLQQKKTFIYPKYFHDSRKEKMLFEEMGACWTVNNYQELEDALKKINNVHSFKPYSQENVEKFLLKTVYNNVRGKDVLGDYVSFIKSVEKK